MNSLHILGLNSRAGIPEIKRAYAAKLKATRPDEDPAAFQRLHEAYKSALEIARTRVSRQESPIDITDATLETDNDDIIDNTETAAGGPVREIVHVTAARQESTTEEFFKSSSSQPAEYAEEAQSDEAVFVFQDFVADLRAIAEQKPPALERWLINHSALYSLEIKHQLVWPLLHYMANADPPLRPERLAALLRFFHLDTVAPRHFQLNALIDAAKDHSTKYWRPDEIAYSYREGRGTYFSRLQFRELSSPRHRGRRAFLMFCPGMKKGIRWIASRLAEVSDNYQRHVAHPTAVSFWMEALDPARVSMWRMLSMAVQISFVVMFLSIATFPSSEAAIAWVTAGFFLFIGWLALAAIDAHRVRSARKVVQQERFRQQSWHNLPVWLVWLIIVLVIQLSHKALE